MGNIFFFGWEVQLMTYLQSIGNGAVTTLATLVTMLGEEYLMIFILGLIYWCVDKELGRKVLLALAGTMIAGSMIKGVVRRRRPYMDNKEIKCIRAPHPKEDIMSIVVQGYSFPSLHAAMSASGYGSIAHETKKKPLVILGIVLPLLIAASRVYLGVHYPTDVLAGLCLGSIMMLALSMVERKYGYKMGFVIILVVGALGFVFCQDNDFYSAWGVTLGLLLGFIYEEKHVGFETSEKWWSYILRPVLGLVIFLVLSTVLKIPGKAIHMEELARLYRAFRYAVTTFVIIGLYPHTFKKI